MEQASTTAPRRGSLPVILATAVVQGWALYGLHRAIAAQSWPATDHAWLFGLYAVAVLIPLTVELVADRAGQRTTWLIVAVMAAMLFYFGWHQGGSVDDPGAKGFAQPEDELSLALVLGILWLHALPFVQARLAARKWTADYQYLFAYSWRNTISLAEALVFTGCFWLLLMLWQSLFHMLGIEFFRELFEKPVFVYPVTSIVFGSALHLIGSIERFVGAVLEQILNVFKWLGIVTGALLALFTLALVVKLPGLVFAGQKAIGAVWLLWLVAVVVLFLNAAYRDGTAAEPYPKWIAAALRLVVPLTTVIALTATYALYVRTEHYGLTVGRIWAFIVAGAALIYSIGYSIAAFNRATWFGGVARVNVLVALSLVVILVLALTPILSPYRLSAGSQYRLVLAGHYEAPPGALRNVSPFAYLRFDAGAYGRRRLEQLARLQNHPDASRIQELAASAQRLTAPWQQTAATRTNEDLLALLQVYPAGRAVDVELGLILRADLRNTQGNCVPDQGRGLIGLFVDLNGDRTDEFVLWTACRGILYQQRGGRWEQVGAVSDPRYFVRGTDLAQELAKGQVMTAPRPWSDLLIGTHRFQVFPNPDATASSSQ